MEAGRRVKRKNGCVRTGLRAQLSDSCLPGEATHRTEVKLWKLLCQRKGAATNNQASSGSAVCVAGVGHRPAVHPVPTAGTGGRRTRLRARS